MQRKLQGGAMSVLVEYIKHFTRFQRNARLYLISNALSGVTVGIILVLYNLYIVSLGYDTAFVGFMLSVITLGAGLAIFPAGLCFDRLGGKVILIWGSVAISIAGMGQLLFREALPLLMSSFIVGVAGAFVVVVNAPFLTHNSTSAERSLLFSLNMVLLLIPMVLGKLIGGVLPLWFSSSPWLMAGLPFWLDGLLASQPQARSYQLAMLFAGIIAAPSFIPLFLMDDDHPPQGNPSCLPLQWTTDWPARCVRTMVGAIPCGRPGWTGGAYFTRIQWTTDWPARCVRTIVGAIPCGQYQSNKPLARAGRPQGIAPTVVTNQPPKRHRTIVGAIPCGRPGWTGGAYFTRIVPCACPGGGWGAYLSESSPLSILVIVQALVGLGAGLFIPYFNIYFVKSLGASPALFGVIDGGANAINACLLLLAPWLAARIGKINTITITRSLAIPLLLTIGLSHLLPLAAVLYLFRQGMMGMATGIFQVFSMEAIAKRRRGFANSVYHVVLQGSWALTTPLGGLIIAGMGYTPVFLMGAMCYLAAIVLLWVRFGRGVGERLALQNEKAHG